MNLADVGAVYRSRLLNGTWTPDMAEQLLSNSSDPESLTAEFRRQNQDPKVKAALDSLLSRPRRRGLVGRPPDISHDDLDALHDLDAPMPRWDLPTEDDGGALDDSSDADLRQDSDEWRVDDGGNPNHDAKGRFAAGGWSHHAAGGARPWRLAFDAREHQKTIDAHKATEAVLRARSMKTAERMSQIRKQGETATPKARAALQRRYEKLAAQHEQHRSAANASRESRLQATKSLEVARAAHAEQRRQAVAGRSEAEWGRRRAEAESFMAIGQHRIGGSEGQPAVHATEPAVLPIAHTPEHHFAIGIHEIRGNPEDGPRKFTANERELSPLERAQRETPSNSAPLAAPADRARLGRQRPPVNEQPTSNQARENAARAHYEAGRPAELPHAAQTVSLPPAHVVTKAHKYLAGILGR